MSAPAPLAAINPHDQQHELKLTTSKQSVQALEYQEENEVTSIFSELGRVQTAKKYWMAVCFCMISALAACMDGFQTKIPGSIIANRGFINQFGTITGKDGLLQLDPQHIAAWGGIFQGGVICGNLYGGFLSDRIGRKWVLAWLTVLLAVGNGIELAAKDWKVWAASRVFTGMGNCLVQTQCVIYIAECAPIAIRGTLLASYAFAYQIGGLTGAIGLQVLQTSNHALDYKRILLSQWIFTGLFIISWFFMPETAWFFCRKGNEENTKRQLKRLYGKSFDADREYSVMALSLQEERRQYGEARSSNFVEIFKGTNLRRFLISAAIPLFAQLSGNSMVNGYTSYFFQLAGMSNPFLGSMIVSIIGLVGILGAFYTSDQFGRRPIALAAACTLSLSLLAIGIMSQLPSTTARSTALISFMCLWAFGFNSGVSPVGPAYQGETATPRLRAKTNSLSQATAQSLSLVFNYSVPLMLAKWNIQAAFLFFGTCTLATIGMFFGLPEYRNRSYQEIDEMFLARVPARKFSTYETTAQVAAREHHTQEV